VAGDDDVDTRRLHNSRRLCWTWTAGNALSSAARGTQ